ncbi:2761_t:CDS:2 [Entrophospora sp. SA101]|nr:13928_t:CDS:2 [Entrophospora sp. SA101]CAJ0763765.1 2761_t:CDS:2 [Entrophospora sp. SA101]
MNSENTITTTAAIDNDSQQTAAVAVAALSFDQTKGLQQQLLWTPQDNNNYSDVNVNDNKCQHITTISSTTIPSAPATPTATTTPTTQKPYETPKVPRPPNAFIIYHRTKSKELARYKSSIRSNSSSSSNNSNNGHPSKTVAEMWREETDAVKLRYQREADLALVEHKKKYPFYKYRPRKRENKNKLKTRGCGGAGNNNKCVNNNNGNWKCCKCVNNNSNCNEGCKCDNLIIINDEFGIVNKDDDHHDGSEVPPEHRKQASMESAFTVFDLKSLEEETDSIDLDNGQSSLVINQPDHLQQQLMFTQDEFQQFPSELSQDDWNSQLFNYINGSNANNDGYYVQNFMNLFAAANPFPLDFSQLNDYN